MQSLWMLLAALLFSLTSLFVKLASDQHTVWEIIAWRGGVGLLVLLPVIARAPRGLRSLATPHWLGHIVRNITGMVSMVAWFTSTGHLPIALSTTLYYTSSIFFGALLLIGSLRAGNGASATMVIALLAGFGGIVLALRPTIAADSIEWALLGLGGALFAAVALRSIRALGQLGEPSSVIVFYFTVFGLLTGLAGTIIGGGRMPGWADGLELLGVGTSAVFAQLCLTRAYSHGHVWLTANLTYTGIVFASLWGILFWGDVLPASSWLGIALIVASGIAATWFVARARPVLTPAALDGVP